jgi:hypothetical protein
MLSKQNSLSTSFSSFASVFLNRGFDFNMAIITTDTRTVLAGGQASLFQGTPTVLTEDTANFTTTFQSNVVVGDTGSAAAKGLDALVTSLNSTNLNGSNSGFIRSAAQLAVIFVSDADDGDSTTTTDEVISFLNTLKPDVTDPITGLTKKAYTINSVVVDTTNSGTNFTTACAAPFENGVKFKTLTTATSGTLASICEADFSAGLTNLSTGIAETITQIPLKRAPDTSTITVTFNGVTVPNNSVNGWTYVSSGQKVVFHGTYIPSDGTTINVTYTPSDIIR